MNLDDFKSFRFSLAYFCCLLSKNVSISSKACRKVFKCILRYSGIFAKTIMQYDT